MKRVKSIARVFDEMYRGCMSDLGCLVDLIFVAIAIWIALGAPGLNELGKAR